MDSYIRISTDLKNKLKVKAAQTGTSIKSLAEIYISQGLKKEEENIMKISVNHPQQQIEKNMD
jgi:plasmid stability protein